MRRLLMAFISCLISVSVFSQEETRLALVIGNANYDEGELKNPVNDARLVASTLESLDFDVTLVENIPDRNAFIKTIKEFGNQREAYDVAFVYYAGHGVQVNSENFLLPTKEVFESEFDVRNQGVSVQNILYYLNLVTDKVNILILDACRNNPFEHHWNPTRSINKGGGLAKMSTPTGSFIAFSTEADYTAFDGSGDNSIYCKSLCDNMLKEHITLDQVFRNVRSDVLNASNKNQRPIEESQLTGHEFYLVKSVYIDGLYYSYGELVEIGWRYFDNYEHDLADRYFTKAIENEPDRPLAYYARGVNYRVGLEFFEGQNVTDNIMDIAIEDQYKSLERLSDNDSNDDFRGDIYGEIAFIKLLQGEGGWCNAFQVACKYGNQKCCNHYIDLCELDDSIVLTDTSIDVEQTICTGYYHNIEFQVGENIISEKFCYSRKSLLYNGVPYTGIVTSSYKNGNIKYEMSYTKGTPDRDTFDYFDDAGNIISEIKIKGKTIIINQ